MCSVFRSASASSAGRSTRANPDVRCPVSRRAGSRARRTLMRGVSTLQRRSPRRLAPTMVSRARPRRPFAAPRSRRRSSRARRASRGCAGRAAAPARVTSPRVSENLTGMPSAFVAPGARVIDLDHHLARGDLRIGEHVADPVDRADRHAGGLEVADPVGRGALAQPLADQRRRARRGSRMRSRVGREPRIVGELRAADHLDDALPVRLVGAADVDPAVLGRERLVRRGEEVRRAGRARRLTPVAKKIAACQ